MQPTEQPAPTQTTPKGYEIPVPTRDQVFGFFKKGFQASGGSGKDDGFNSTRHVRYYD